MNSLWWILGGLTLLIVGGAVYLYFANNKGSGSRKIAPASPSARPLQVMKVLKRGAKGLVDGTALKWLLSLLGILIAVWMIISVIHTMTKPHVPKAAGNSVSEAQSARPNRNVSGADCTGEVSVKAPARSPFADAESERESAYWAEVPLGHCNWRVSTPAEGDKTFRRACLTVTRTFQEWTDENGQDISNGRCEKYLATYVQKVWPTDADGTPLPASPEAEAPLSITFTLRP